MHKEIIIHVGRAISADAKGHSYYYSLYADQEHMENCDRLGGDECTGETLIEAIESAATEAQCYLALHHAKN